MNNTSKQRAPMYKVRPFTRTARSQPLTKLARRLRASVGESIVETLAAVIICTFALLMMYTAVATAGRMNAQADAAAAALRESAIAAEVQQVTANIENYQEVFIEGYETPYLVEYFKAESAPDAQNPGSTNGTGYISYTLVN